MPLPNHLSPQLLHHVTTTLLCGEPDLKQLREVLISELHLSLDAMTELIYHLVLDLNQSLFPPLSHLELVHTEGCNLACTYCFEKDMLGHKKMPADIACRAVDLLFDYSGDETELQITHFGGEPTLNFVGIQAATEYAESRAIVAKKAVEFDMTTNGILLDDYMAAYCSDHRINVLLSIDGSESSHDRHRVDKRGRGTFKRVIQGLETLKKRQAWVGTKMTVMPDNAGLLFNDVLELYDLGVNHFIIGHATGVEWSADEMKTFEDQLRQLYLWYNDNRRADLRIDDFEKNDEGPFFGCRAGRNSVAISVRGEISPCSKIMGFDSNRLVGKLGDIWHGLTHLKNRHEFVSCSRVISSCEDQGIEQEFQGGCFAVNYGESGDLFQPSPNEHKFSILRRSACSGCSGCSN